MLGQRFTELVEDCLERLDQGEDLLVVLDDYPDYRDRLEPLLLVALASRAFPVPVPNQTAKRMGKSQLLAELDLLEEQGTLRRSPEIPPPARWAGKLGQAVRSRGLTNPSPGFRLGMVALIMVLGAGFFTLNASASGFPGEMVNYFLAGYNQVIQALSFNLAGAGGPDFSLVPYFPGRNLNFENQIANKVVFLLYSGEEDDQDFHPGNQGGFQHQHTTSPDPGAMAGGSSAAPQNAENNGLALGHDKEPDNNGLALGQDKDPEEGGLALGRNQDPQDKGLALGANKDHHNPGLALGRDKNLKEKIKEEQDNSDG